MRVEATPSSPFQKRGVDGDGLTVKKKKIWRGGTGSVGEGSGLDLGYNLGQVSWVAQVLGGLVRG
jgi:hypothetical protein